MILIVSQEQNPLIVGNKDDIVLSLFEGFSAYRETKGTGIEDVPELDEQHADESGRKPNKEEGSLMSFLQAARIHDPRPENRRKSKEDQDDRRHRTQTDGSHHSASN